MQAKIQRRLPAVRAYHKKRYTPTPEENDGAVGVDFPSSSTASSPSLPLSTPSPNGAASGGGQATTRTSKTGTPVGLIVGVTLTLFAIILVLGAYLYRRHSMKARMKLRGWVDKRGRAVISPWTDSTEKLTITEPSPTATASRGLGRALAGVPLANGPPYIPPTRSSISRPASNYRSSQGAAITSSTMETVKVASTFIPTLPDELAIGVGDTLRILARYDDSWALCLNQRGEKGMVPLECFNRGEALGSGGAQDTWRSSRISSLATVQPYDGYA